MFLEGCWYKYNPGDYGYFVNFITHVELLSCIGINGEFSRNRSSTCQC